MSAVLLLVSTLAVAQHLLHGDLLFVVQPRKGGFAGAIAEATNKASEAQIIHVAIVLQEDGETRILEASDEHGVWTCPIDTFLAHVPRTADGKPSLLVGRLKKRSIVNASVERAKSYIGRPYDWVFSTDEDAIYCSELIQLSYRTRKGKPVFPLQPMSFHDASGAILPYWTEHYAKRGMAVPEGAPGTNPGDISRSRKLRLIEVKELRN